MYLREGRSHSDLFFCLGRKKLSLPAGTSSYCHYRRGRWRGSECSTWAAWIQQWIDAKPLIEWILFQKGGKKLMLQSSAFISFSAVYSVNVTGACVGRVHLWGGTENMCMLFHFLSFLCGNKDAFFPPWMSEQFNLLLQLKINKSIAFGNSLEFQLPKKMGCFFGGSQSWSPGFAGLETRPWKPYLDFMHDHWCLAFIYFCLC